MRTRTNGQKISAGLIVSAAAFGALVEVAFAEKVELPPRKPGQWEVEMATGGTDATPAMTIQVCLDEATDKEMMTAGLSMAGDMCAKNEMRRDGDLYIIDAECELGQMKTKSRTEISGDFKANYTMKVTGTVDGLPLGLGDDKANKETVVTQKARWVSDTCANGLKPGEMEMPGGIRIDAAKVMKDFNGPTTKE